MPNTPLKPAAFRSAGYILILFDDDIPDIHKFRVRPQAFQIVELPGFLGKNVDDDAAVIQQLPGIAPVAFPAEHLLPQLLQRVLGIVAERLDVGVGGAGADQKVIRKRADPVNFQQLDVLSFLASSALVTS